MLQLKKKIILILMLISINVFSQESEKKYSISFNNLTQIEIINLIENKTPFKFYFLDSWLEPGKTSNNFLNTTITSILSALFKNSNLNFYVDGKKIILTKGTLIHKSIYEDKVKNTLTLVSPTTKPFFIQNKSNEEIETITIGKEKKGNSSTAYKITGITTNTETGLPVENLVLLERKKNISTATNKKGEFSIKLPFGTNTIETLLLGYKQTKKNLILFNDGKLNFSVIEESELLDELILRTNKNSNVKEVISGITQIEMKQIKNIPQVLGERDILKVATTMPGIKSAGEGAEGVNVRGGKVDQNLFLLDQSVLYNPTHFLGLFSAINPFTTNDVKIYKGNAPAEYGGRISSVFDIKSKDSNTKKFSGEASVGPVTSNVSLEIPVIKDKSGLLLGARSTYSDWILKSLNDESLSNSSASFYDLNAKYHHAFDAKNTVRVNAYHSNDKFRIASDTTNSYSNTLASINWQHKFNDKNNGNLIISNSNYAFDIDFDGKANKNFKLKYKINETSLKLKMKYTYSKKHTFDYGISSKLYNVSPGSIAPRDNKSIITPLEVDKEKALESAVFLSDAFDLNKKLAINVGLRYSVYMALGESTQRIYQPNSPKNDATLINTVDYKNNEVYKTYQGFEYRVSGRYSLNQDLSLKASINKSYQFIHRLSNNTSASPTDVWKLSDTNIKPQEANQFSLGLFKNYDVNDYEISLEGYYKEYKNILDYKVGASFLLSEKIETEVLQGPGKSYGVEFLVKKNVGKLNGWFGYSYSRTLIKLDSPFNSERVNNGEFFPTNYDKPHDFNLIANYKLTNRYSISSSFTYQTGRPITYPTGKYIYQGSEYLLYSDRNKFRIPDYFRLDLGLNIEGNHKIKKFAHSFWNISVYNVLGRNNPYAVFFVTENGTVKAYQSSIFSTPIPTITYNFKF
jgi:hypothetical protein